MKRLLASTAIAMTLASSAFADAHTALKNYQMDAANDLRASDFIGMRVYATEQDTSQMQTVTADGATEWDDIGEINDLILTRSGDIASVIVGVGGFLGMGEKDVSLDMTQINFVAEQDDPDDMFLVINANADALRDVEGFMSDDDETETASAEENDDEGSTYSDTANETATAGTAKIEDDDDEQSDTANSDEAASDTDQETEMANADSAMERPVLTAPSIEREGYMQAKIDQLTSEDLTGARIYGANDEDIGEISELLLTDSGELDRAVLDIGGFFGLGEKSVAVTMDELTILQSDEGGVRVFIDATEETLKAQPDYEG